MELTENKKSVILDYEEYMQMKDDIESLSNEVKNLKSGMSVIYKHRGGGNFDRIFLNNSDAFTESINALKEKIKQREDQLERKNGEIAGLTENKDFIIHQKNREVRELESNERTLRWDIKELELKNHKLKLFNWAILASGVVVFLVTLIKAVMS